MEKAGVALAILGVLGVLLAGLALVATIVAPIAGNVSGDEQIPFLIGGSSCCCLSAVLLVVGAGLVGVSRKNE